MPEIKKIMENISEVKDNKKSSKKAVPKGNSMASCSRRQSEPKKGKRTALDDVEKVNKKKKIIKRAPKDSNRKTKNKVEYTYEPISSDETEDNNFTDNTSDDDYEEYEGLEIRNSKDKIKNLEPVFFKSENTPPYIRKYVENITEPTTSAFTTAHDVPIIIQQLTIGANENSQETFNILCPTLKIEKEMQNLFADKEAFGVLEDHLMNDYKINRVPYSAFVPNLKLSAAHSLNLKKIRTVLNLLWNFSAILPHFMRQVADCDFNKFIKKFFIKALIILFNIYQTQVFMLRAITWPKELRELKAKYIKAPLVKGSLWNIKENDAQKLTDEQRSKRKQFFRSNENRRYRGRASRGRFRSNFRNHSRRPARSSNEK